MSLFNFLSIFSIEIFLLITLSYIFICSFLILSFFKIDLFIDLSLSLIILSYLLLEYILLSKLSFILIFCLSFSRVWLFTKFKSNWNLFNLLHTTSDFNISYFLLFFIILLFKFEFVLTLLIKLLTKFFVCILFISLSSFILLFYFLNLFRSIILPFWLFFL